MVDRIREALDAAVELDGVAVRVEASVGHCRVPAGWGQRRRHPARRGCGHVRRKGGPVGIRHLQRRTVATSRRGSRWPNELRRAIDNRELFLAYQPKVSLVTDTIVGVEALVRWRHPHRGLVMPDEFIMIAQQTSLIRPLTLYVLGEALDQLARWRDQGLDLSMAVNLSVRNLVDAGLPAEVRGLLSVANVPASSLVLEITESALISDPFHVRVVLDELAAMGVQISIDDFGTGYSSLSHLKRLPIHEIKIDRSFVMNLAASDEDAIIVRSTVDLANNLGLRVVAEGVETVETLARLRAMGCDVAQGYHLAPPLGVADFEKWLQDREDDQRRQVEADAA